MANDITKSPHILDTVGVVQTQDIFIKSIRWVSVGGVAGDQCIVTDPNDRVIWEGVAPGANHAEEAIIEKYIKGGYKVNTLDAGKVYISYGR